MIVYGFGFSLSGAFVVSINLRLPYQTSCVSNSSFSWDACCCLRPCTRAKTAGTKTSVAMVAHSRPPITARPSGAFCSPPSPSPSDMGHHADDHGQRGHQYRTKAGAACFECSLHGVAMLRQLCFCKGNHQDAVRRGDAHAQNSAHHRRYAQPGVGKERKRTMPASAAGSAVMMTNGSSQDWKFTTMSM